MLLSNAAGQLSSQRTRPFGPMDTLERSLPWKEHLEESRPRKPLTQTTEGVSVDKRAKEWDKGLAPRNVSMAPTSTYLTDRRYATRKPLSSVQQPSVFKTDRRHVTRKPLSSVQQPSVLKSTRPDKHPREAKHGSDRRTEEDEQSIVDFPTRLREDPAILSFRPGDASPHAAPKAGCLSPMLISDLHGCMEGPHQHPSAGPRRSIECSHSSSILEFRAVRPQPTSAVVDPSYAPRCTSPSKSGQSEFSRRSVSRQSMSSHEANYWDCAIPESPHPTSNRQTADWDPDKEYQALLDYTYPLRPGHVDTLDNFDLQGDSLQHQDPALQDSGVELDLLCRSTSLSGLSLSQNSPRRTNVWEGGHQKITSSGLCSKTLRNSAESLDRFGAGKDGVQDGHQLQRSRPPSAIAFIRTTDVLPQSGCVHDDLDQEFLSLPDRFEELQFLPRQVREVTAILNTTRTPEKNPAPEVEESSQDDEKEKMSADATQSVTRSSRSWMESVGGGLTCDNNQEMETLVEQLCGLDLRDTERTALADQDQDSSLIQHIHMFSSLLQQHIRWLYMLSDQTGMSAAPTDGVPKWLAEYQEFHEEMGSHQPLMSRVLHSGEQLLSYMDATSPVLANALMLIERQSAALKNHTRSFLSSVQSTVDNLTQRTHPV
uniref:centrosomal protein of 68 kDa isoform X2 n=1 Tax=Doryrhamphus excisus TaxID=161450 RepID=UPI0025ADD7EB|nr:centrosomal protein of 68 kDa isoform X2 [Doryrhamphus excisus]